MMKCEHYREMFLDRNAGLLNPDEVAELQQHLDNCAACREELAATQLVWDELGAIKAPAPSAAMDTRFQAMLKDFKQTANQPAQPGWVKQLRQLWQMQYRLPLAYACVLLILGIGTAFWLARNNSEKQQLLTLQAQVHDLKQTMMLTMLDNPLASERLKAVSYTSDIRRPDKKVIEALLETLNSDPNVNVRLSTLEALSQLGSYPEVRLGLIQSITAQESPLVQSAIADVMLKLQEKRSVQSFKELLKQKDLDGEIREKIKTTITKLI